MPLNVTKSLDKTLDDSHLEMRRTCQRFAEVEITPHVYEWEEAELFPAELYKKAGDVGILGIGFPEEVGGSGGDALHSIMVTEGLMVSGSTGVIAGLFSGGIALPPIVQGKDPDQIDRFVRPVLAGDKISALGITEPGAGSDVSAVRTRAVRDGHDYIINGAKLFITSGCRADFVTVLCRTGEDAHGGLTFFVVEKGMPGFSATRALKKTGWRASDTAELTFEDVRVPARNRIGQEGGAFVTLMRNFQSERLALAAMGHAAAEVALTVAAEYAKDRKVFGKTVMGFQVTRHKLADMATRVLASKTLNYHVAHRVAAGDYLVAEVSMAKNFAAEVAMSVTYDAVQLMGGMGYMRESVVERLSRDARLLPIGGGTQEVMKEIIAKALAF